MAAQLVDAKEGAQIWSERLDRKLEEIFDIQDDVANSIISAIAPEISQAEITRFRRRPPDSVDAWGLYQRALALYPSGDKIDFETAIYDTEGPCREGGAPWEPTTGHGAWRS